MTFRRAPARVQYLHSTDGFFSYVLFNIHSSLQSSTVKRSWQLFCSGFSKPSDRYSAC